MSEDQMLIKMAVVRSTISSSPSEKCVVSQAKMAQR